jgi:hypothetical protein
MRPSTARRRNDAECFRPCLQRPSRRWSSERRCRGRARASERGRGWLGAARVGRVGVCASPSACVGCSAAATRLWFMCRCGVRSARVCRALSSFALRCRRTACACGRQVLEELAKREAAQNEALRAREDAAKLIQALVRQRKTLRAFRTLMRLAKAVSLVARVIRRIRRRARRRAALFVQAHLRAYICHTHGICSHHTIMLIITSTRAAHTRALQRSAAPLRRRRSVAALISCRCTACCAQDGQSSLRHV